MALRDEQKNKDAVHAFLINNDMDPNKGMDYKNKFGTSYYVGDSRKFAEETRIGFDITDTSGINVSLHEINDIEYETAFKITEQMFDYDETLETLTITGDESKKHNEAYKIVINSIYLDF